jgi:hypothetical protein
LFIDGDMLLREDIAQLWALRNALHSVMVVKHAEFSGTHSFLNNSLPAFPKFNWSSVMLFNNAKCTKLTPEYITIAEYHDLHQFKWLDEEHQLGTLPNTWNYLVGYSEPNADTALVHWTLGGPYFGGEYESTEYAQEWFAMRDKTFFAHAKG